MKIHQNNNYLKNLGPTAAETQAMIQAEENRKKLRTESESAEKIRKFEDAVKEKGMKQPGSDSRDASFKKSLSQGDTPQKIESSQAREEPPPPPSTRIDIRI